MDSDTLLALAQRAEAGGDDALSDDCWIALGWGCLKAPSGARGWIAPGTREVSWQARADLRVSLDAVEEVPGRIVHALYLFKSNQWCASLDMLEMSVCAPTECLARLAAKLKALAAQKESGGG